MINSSKLIGIRGLVVSLSVRWPSWRSEQNTQETIHRTNRCWRSTRSGI